MLTDQELIKGCIGGDRAIQRALYDRYCKKMMAICLRYARSREEAEDNLQEGFVKVFANIRGFRGDSKLETWITRIMINNSLTHQQQKFYLTPMVSSDGVNIPEGEEISLSAFHFTELISIIQSLPDGCRVIFNMFAIEGFGHKEIAEMLGISEGTSKSQYSRAKNLLRNKLSGPEKVLRRYGE